MILRDVTPADHTAIATLVRAAFLGAFGRSDEPELIAALRARGDVVLERVADDDGVVAGHILFSRAFVEAETGRHPVIQLAPVSAAPDRQRSGIGAALIRDGLAILGARGETQVFLLGHPGYYPRFGFSAAAARPFRSPWDGPHHQMLVLNPGGPDAGRLMASAAFG